MKILGTPLMQGYFFLVSNMNNLVCYSFYLTIREMAPSPCNIPLCCKIHVKQEKEMYLKTNQTFPSFAS